jgi:signal transduction histidine kinase
VLPPSETTQTAGFLSLAAGSRLPGWRLALTLQDGNQIDATAVERNRLHLWTGVLVVLFTSILGLFIARAFRRQLRLANLKNDLVGTVSHELKTPLASMRLLVETLLDEERLEEEPTREYLQLIAKENMRLSRLIENFLTFTRMEQGRQQFEFRDVAPAEIVASAVEAGGERFRKPDCSLTVEVDKELPLIYGDKDGLVTVLLNLLDNAYKYSDGPRDIAVRAKAHNEAVHFSVSDNGIGLPRTASRRVFQRFFQVDQTLARKGQGCGLGLSIVDYIVRAHQGSVVVTSNLGEGSTFTVTLPVAADHTLECAEVQV